MADPHPTLEWWLRRVWNANGMILYDWFETKTVTGEQVRAFVRNWLEHAPAPSAGKRMVWTPLTEEQKTEALQRAFPDNDYQLPPEEKD